MEVLNKGLPVRAVFIAIPLLLLAACGGGSSTVPASTTVPPPSPPVVEPETYQGTIDSFSNVSAQNLPGGLNAQCMDAEARDMDNDGDIDLVLAIEFGANILLENDGSGVFSKATGLPNTLRDSEDIAVADFDGDGRLDLFFVSEDDRVNELYLNQGGGTYSDASNRINFGGTSNAVVTTDLNNDGAMDLIIGNVGQLGVLINDGSGFFSNETQTRFTLNSYAIQDLALADVDNDGDMDLLTADEERNRVFINDGSGQFLDETSSRLPNVIDETREVITADIDNDGDIDIYYANVAFLSNHSPHNRLLINNGNGVFSEVTDAQLVTNPNEDNFSARFVELTGDGAPDLIVPRSFVFGDVAGSYRTYVNDNNGRFIKANLSPALPVGNGFDIAEADFNGDGKQDMYLCNRANGDPGTTSSIGGTDALMFRD